MASPSPILKRRRGPRVVPPGLHSRLARRSLPPRVTAERRSPDAHKKSEQSAAHFRSSSVNPPSSAAAPQTSPQQLGVPHSGGGGHKPRAPPGVGAHLRSAATAPFAVTTGGSTLSSHKTLDSSSSYPQAPAPGGISPTTTDGRGVTGGATSTERDHRRPVSNPSQPAVGHTLGPFSMDSVAVASLMNLQAGASGKSRTTNAQGLAMDSAAPSPRGVLGGGERVCRVPCPVVCTRGASVLLGVTTVPLTHVSLCSHVCFVVHVALCAGHCACFALPLTGCGACLE